MNTFGKFECSAFVGLKLILLRKSCTDYILLHILAIK